MSKVTWWASLSSAATFGTWSSGACASSGHSWVVSSLTSSTVSSNWDLFQVSNFGPDVFGRVLNLAVIIWVENANPYSAQTQFTVHAFTNTLHIAVQHWESEANSHDWDDRECDRGVGHEAVSLDSALVIHSCQLRSSRQLNQLKGEYTLIGLQQQAFICTQGFIFGPLRFWVLSFRWCAPLLGTLNFRGASTVPPHFTMTIDFVTIVVVDWGKNWPWIGDRLFWNGRGRWHLSALIYTVLMVLVWQLVLPFATNP